MPVDQTLIKPAIDRITQRLPSLQTDLSEEQVNFIIHDISVSSYLKACPGSGKTEVVGIKSAYEIADWKDPYSGLAILSFTKNAAKEISDRIAKYSAAGRSPYPHFVGTIDSWLHSYILHPFSHRVFGYKGTNKDKSYRLIDNEDRYDFLNSYKTTLSVTPYKDAFVNEYYYECTEPLSIQSQSRTLNVIGISTQAQADLKTNKSNFLKAGLCTYSDAELLCYLLLKKQGNLVQTLVKRFPVFCIDECQDLSLNQLAILKLLLEKGAIVHLIGDNNQAIYEFKRVYVENINSFIKDQSLVEKALTKNFRSNQQIVNVCSAIAKYNTGAYESIIGNEKEITTNCCLLWEYTTNEFKNLPQRFIDKIKFLNGSLGEQLEHIDINDCAILARGHSTLNDFRNGSSAEFGKIELFANALNCWNSLPKNSKSMQTALQDLGRAICVLAYNGKGNYQNQCCPEFYTHMEWRNTLSNLLERTSATVGIYPFDGLTWSQWAGNLKRFLESYWPKFSNPTNTFEDVKGKIKAPQGDASKLVSTKIKDVHYQYTEKIRLTTFHDIKGETLSAALIVSSKDKKSKGGYFEHWLSSQPDEKEFVRFAYVASSRPKHLLIWAIPKLTNNSFRQKILDLGFILE